MKALFCKIVKKSTGEREQKGRGGAQASNGCTCISTAGALETRTRCSPTRMYEYAMSRAAHIIIHNNLTLFLNVKDGTHARAYRASARRARRNGAHPGEVRQAQGARLHLPLTDPDRRSLTTSDH